ncbi:MAG: carboxylating nicotinate-nucleotide diphosphorylase [Proteobacteria bacterium]|nr:MAG: carboxylating nicotinate-nucleotide diphosphorylase [Pseudomonadota bacterium]
MHELHGIQIEPIIERALEEDWGYGDWTTDLCVEKGKKARARIICKEDCVAAGLDVAAAVFRKVDPELDIQIKIENGQFVKDRTEFLSISGRARSILKAERIALNLMGRMCGIATLTREYVAQLEGTKTQLLDTRKTTPGLRILEKSATVLGGARNHRFGLSDGALVKENHIRAAGSITAAVNRLQEGLPPTIKIEVETTNIAEVKEALAAGADIIMFDNMSVDEMKEAMKVVNGKAIIEASGNVRLHNVRAIAETGVNFISTSSIITAARWSDLSLLFDI